MELSRSSDVIRHGNYVDGQADCHWSQCVRAGSAMVSSGGNVVDTVTD